MIVNKSAYDERYHHIKNGVCEFNDKFQMGIRILPVTTSTSSVYDKYSSLRSTAGQFIRIVSGEETEQVDSFEKTVKPKVEDYLRKQGWSEEQINHFLDVVKDVLFVDGNFSVPDTSFFKYVPIVPRNGVDEQIPKYNYYKSGQQTITSYLVSMLKDVRINLKTTCEKNLFLDIISNALSESVLSAPSDEEITRTYTVPAYIQESFSQDLAWFFDLDEQTKVKYFPLFLHFYLCFSITQTLLLLSPEKSNSECLCSPEIFYFILASEKTSVNHDAVKYGWSAKIQERKILEKLFGKMQALDIANSLLNDSVGYYPQILERLSEFPFEDNKIALSNILAAYNSEKTALLKKRKGEENRQPLDINPNVSSYEDFLKKMERCCVELQAKEYSRVGTKIRNILSIKFLSKRRDKDVLVLDNEMLFFLIALVTKGERTKLEDMYKNFNKYGICFNRETRSAIEEYLLKMNLLDRKSDSGEVQYVKIVL